MENQLSDVLDNILGLLLLEGSYEIEEADEAFEVSIETADAGRLIGARGESLDGLQLLVNQIMSKKINEGEFKRVILDVGGWRKQRQEDLEKNAKDWGNQVLETGKEMELEPFSAWQRRVIHTVISEMGGLSSESIGEGRDRHIVIKLKDQNNTPSLQEPKTKTEETNAETAKG